jgi:hypothetical protein
VGCTRAARCCFNGPPLSLYPSISLAAPHSGTARKAQGLPATTPRWRGDGSEARRRGGGLATLWQKAQHLPGVRDSMLYSSSNRLARRELPMLPRNRRYAMASNWIVGGE